MEEITITRALAELKLLDNKINKKIDESEFVHFLSKKNKAVNNLDHLNVNSKASFQSITDLINRRKMLKSAIILSNASTLVKLNNETITVAEVIETKQLVEFYKKLLTKMKQNREQVLNLVEKHNYSMDNDLQKLLEISFGKTSNTKTNTDDIDNISKTFREQNRADILDSINLDSKIKDVEHTITQYETESNFVLAESNAITKIKI